jgi:hypothetical protein
LIAAIWSSLNPTTAVVRVLFLPGTDRSSHVTGDAQVLEVCAGQLGLEQRAQRRGADKVIAPARDGEQTAERREGKHVGAAQTAPDALEPTHAGVVWLGRKIRSVDSADGGADHEVRRDALARERPQHADLHRA